MNKAIPIAVLTAILATATISLALYQQAEAYKVVQKCVNGICTVTVTGNMTGKTSTSTSKSCQNGVCTITSCVNGQCTTETTTTAK